MDTHRAAPSPSTRPDAASAPPDAERARLLQHVAQDRSDLVQVASSLRAAADSVEHARRSLIDSGQLLRWLHAAANVAAIAMWLRTGRRPPLLLLASMSLQLFNAVTARPRRPA
jgi:hypothetical protein